MGVPSPVSGNVRVLDRDNGQAGLLAPTSRGWTGSNLTLVASRGYVLRFVPSRSMTITKIAFGLVTAAGADDAVCVGIYSSALVRLATSGAVTGKLNGTNGTAPTVDLTAAYTVSPGTVYYAGFSSGAQGGTAAVVGGATWNSAANVKLFGTTAGLLDVDAAAASHVLPDPFVLGGASSAFPIVALRES